MKTALKLLAGLVGLLAVATCLPIAVLCIIAGLWTGFTAKLGLCAMAAVLYAAGTVVLAHDYATERRKYHPAWLVLCSIPLCFSGAYDLSRRLSPSPSQPRLAADSGQRGAQEDSAAREFFLQDVRRSLGGLVAQYGPISAEPRVPGAPHGVQFKFPDAGVLVVVREPGEKPLPPAEYPKVYKQPFSDDDVGVLAGTSRADHEAWVRQVYRAVEDSIEQTRRQKKRGGFKPRR